MKRRGRISLRERLERNHATLSFYAKGAGKPPPPKPALLVAMEERAARRRPRSASGRPLERDVLKAVIQALKLDRRVSSVERNQSGVFQDGERYIRVGTRGKLDLTVYLKDGRYAELEVKRDARTKPEEHQLRRIEAIRRDGGIAGWCYDVPSALAVLP